MGWISMPRTMISLWFVNYCLIALIGMFSSGGRLPIFWTLVQATVILIIESIFLSLLCEDNGKGVGK